MLASRQQELADCKTEQTGQIQMGDKLKEERLRVGFGQTTNQQNSFTASWHISTPGGINGIDPKHIPSFGDLMVVMYSSVYIIELKSLLAGALGLDPQRSWHMIQVIFILIKPPISTDLFRSVLYLVTVCRKKSL